MRKIIKLMAEYSAFPIWYESPGRNAGQPINPKDLPISEGLENRINQWMEWYDSTLNLDDPATSGFETAKNEADFEREGVDIWITLSRELEEHYTVWYFSELRGELLTELPKD